MLENRSPQAAQSAHHLAPQSHPSTTEVPSRTKSSRDKFLTSEECRRLVAIVREKGSHRDGLLLLLGMSLATRAGELVRLRVSDFHPECGFVSVPTLKRRSPAEKRARRETRARGAQWIKSPLKRGELPQLHIEVPLDSEIFGIAEEYVRVNSLTSWLFPGRGDGHLSKRQAERVFKFWAARAGLSKHASLHALRHARGVDLYEKGLDIVEIRDFLRHESLSSTSFYQHLSPTRLEMMRQKVGVLGLPEGPA